MVIPAPLTLKAALRLMQIHELPADEASYQRTDCRLPQAAELVGKVMALLLLTVPPVPLDAVVLPADCVPDHWVSPAVTATRA